MKSLSKSFQDRVDTGAEIQAITNFLAATWDLDALSSAAPDSDKSAVESLVEGAFLAGYTALPDNLVHPAVSTALLSASEKRETALEPQPGRGQDFPMFDGIAQGYKLLLKACLREQQTRSSSIDKVLGERLSDLEYQVNNEFSGASEIFPKGYEAFTADYHEQKGILDLDEASLKDLFDGHDTTFSMANELPIRLSLPHIAFDDLDQGRPPMKMLLMTLFAQGSELRAYNNTVQFLGELSRHVDNDQPYAESLPVPDASCPALSSLWDKIPEASIEKFSPMTEKKARILSRPSASPSPGP